MIQSVLFETHRSSKFFTWQNPLEIFGLSASLMLIPSKQNPWDLRKKRIFNIFLSKTKKNIGWKKIVFEIFYILLLPIYTKNQQYWAAQTFLRIKVVNKKIRLAFFHSQKSFFCIFMQHRTDFENFFSTSKKLRKNRL